MNESQEHLLTVMEQRDAARRLFNRLDAAISHHRKAKEGHGGFVDDTDEALHAAHDRILKAAAGKDS